ncbi:hypothetical protein Nepgr_030885 [Nepenthes gracilis]|uniref:Secreted protein n=1 Tax=Nepenthes gracilis TaxID=150966 RepID=A0AAD3THU6_NEPGR|nr:hypothetical protein Nepgr_030885 [Nepenthes gracilis]
MQLNVIYLIASLGLSVSVSAEVNLVVYLWSQSLILLLCVPLRGWHPKCFLGFPTAVSWVDECSLKPFESSHASKFNKVTIFGGVASIEESEEQR